MNVLLFIFLAINQIGGDTKPIISIENDTIKVFNEDLSLKNYYVISNENNVPIGKFDFKFLKDSIYFLGGISGDIYTLKNKSLKRVDQTPDHRLNITSSIYIHNDTLFKYGGYGYWSQRNFNIYFDFESKEWQVYKTSKNSYIPEGSFFGLHLKTSKGVYFFGGKKVNETNRIKQHINKDVLFFDFQSKAFNYLGKSNLDFNSDHYLIHDDQHIYLVKEDILYQISPKQNLIQTYNYPNRLWNLSKNKRFNVFSNGHYFIRVYDLSLKRDKFIRMNKEELLNSPLNSIALYEKEYSIIPILYGLVVALVGLICFFLINNVVKKNRIILKKDSIIFKRTNYPLEPMEVEILLILIRFKKITTKQVLNVVENKNFTYVHNTRIKDKIMKELNIKLKTILNLENLPIREIRLSEDRRIKVFELETSALKFFNRIKVFR